MRDRGIDDSLRKLHSAAIQSFFMEKTVGQSPSIYGRDDEVMVHPLLDHQDQQNAQVAEPQLLRVRQRLLAESGGRNAQPVSEIDPETGLPMLPPVAPADQTEELQQRCSKYSTKALVFAITMLAAYLGSASSSRSVTFWIAMAAYFIAICADFISACARTMPERGCALVYLSSFLLVTVSYRCYLSPSTRTTATQSSLCRSQSSLHSFTASGALPQRDNKVWHQ